VAVISLLIFKGGIRKKHILIILLLLIIGIAIYFFVPMKFSFRNNINSNNINKISIYRHGYFDEKYNTDTLTITNGEKVGEIVSHINNLYCTKRFTFVQSPLPKSQYEYVVHFEYKNNIITISINNSVIQVTVNGKDKIFNVTSKNAMEYFDNIFGKI
jgi:hypothetical protein